MYELEWLRAKLVVFMREIAVRYYSALLFLLSEMKNHPYITELFPLGIHDSTPTKLMSKQIS